MIEVMDMIGVGQEVTEAFERECCHGDSRAHALRRVQELLNDLAEIPEANRAIGRFYQHSRMSSARRERMRREPE